MVDVPESFTLRAKLTVTHKRCVGYDWQTGQYQYRQVGETEHYNLITDAGRVGVHTYIYGTAVQRAGASPVVSNVGLNYIGLSNDGTAPAAGDTSLASELSGNGLTRAQGTVTLPTGSGTMTTISRTFTYTGGGTQQVQKTALFDDPTTGRMAHEILFTARTLATNDQLTLTFQITLSLARGLTWPILSLLMPAYKPQTMLSR